MVGLGLPPPALFTFFPSCRMLFSGRKGVVKGCSVLLFTLKPKKASVPKKQVLKDVAERASKP
jgi:hypothetical protein